MTTQMTVPFNRPALTGKEEIYIRQAMMNGKLSGDGPFTLACSKWIKARFFPGKPCLTTSCTHALEMAALLLDLKEDDEIIMPSYTFVSTANAFVLRGAKIVFVDIRPDTMNIDEKKIEQAVTARTKAIVPVHYAGVACEMDEIMRVARKYGLAVVEDAAQGVMSTYKGKALGSIGDFGCYSFHETKNYNCGEGGALLIQDERYFETAEIIREKGTNRARFFRGEVDKYSWVDVGSSYLPSELNAAFLLAQLEQADEINRQRLTIWNLYHSELLPLAEKGWIELPHVPEDCRHNGHMYYLKLRDQEQRDAFIQYLKNSGIGSVFHYVPLHSTAAGQRYGRFDGEDLFTTRESERLVRLPLYYSLSEDDAFFVVRQTASFFGESVPASAYKPLSDVRI